jgi:AmmeMemoRadiSam system protein B
MSTRNDATTVRPPAIAGVFYPGDPKALAETIERLLSSAPVTKLPEARLKALIVPHAGYPYSGVRCCINKSWINNHHTSNLSRGFRWLCWCAKRSHPV